MSASEKRSAFDQAWAAVKSGKPEKLAEVLQKNPEIVNYEKNDKNLLSGALEHWSSVPKENTRKVVKKDYPILTFVKILLDAKIDLNIVKTFTETDAVEVPLRSAIHRNSLSITKLLIRHGAQIDHLYESVLSTKTTNRSKILKLFLRLGVDFSKPFSGYISLHGWYNQYNGTWFDLAHTASDPRARSILRFAVRKQKMAVWMFCSCQAANPSGSTLKKTSIRSKKMFHFPRINSFRDKKMSEWDDLCQEFHQKCHPHVPLGFCSMPLDKMTAFVKSLLDSR